VLGWPVAHSRSPAIQNAALEAAALDDWRYQLLPAPPELFAEIVRGLPGAGFRGANVTIPHKEAALALGDRASPRAKGIGAANTLLFDSDGAVQADNTDAPALIESLPFPAAGCSALVLGAGGSARAAVWALRNAGAEVSIWNRTAQRGAALADALGASVATSGSHRADLLVNCTAAGLADPSAMFDELPVSPDRLSDFCCVVDFVYGAEPTPLVQAARGRSIPVVDGLELLVAQGALSFELFTGVAASREVMRAAVEERRRS
jgi:shikimate dehydrogenase